MKVAAEILVAPGRGYVLRLHAAAPPGFPDDFRVVLEELSYYDGNDDVLLVVEAAELSGRITGLNGPRDYEVSFAGTLNFALADGQLGTFLELNSERGVDYTLFLASKDGAVELWSGDDWEFIENRNVVLTGVSRRG